MVRTLLASCIWACLAAWSVGQELRVETLDAPPAADLVSPEVAATLQPTGLAIKRGENRTVCEIWLVKELPSANGDETSAEILYPLSPGSLVGLIRFRSRGADFRDQEVPRGTYTLRYGRQPVDGNHVGTFPTRDFLVLNSAESDRQPNPIEEMELQQSSAQSIGSSHPGILCLLKPAESNDSSASPSLVHDEERDFWVLNIKANRQGGGQLMLALVLQGHVSE